MSTNYQRKASQSQGFGSGQIRCFCLNTDPIIRCLKIMTKDRQKNEKGNNFLLKIIIK